MYLSNELFTSIVAHTPLVSIDLIVRNQAGEILLGKRKNRPARGYWFVPGGRIQKNETIIAAFRRLTGEELGAPYEFGSANFVGVYEHHYNDNFAGEGFTTHYVVLAYELALADDVPLPDQQHDCYCWLRPSDISGKDGVHANTRAYFTG